MLKALVPCLDKPVCVFVSFVHSFYFKLIFEVIIFALFNSRFFRCLKDKEELLGILPVDSRKLENVKGELLKLTKKGTMAQRSLDRRAEETEQNNIRLSVMAQRGQKRRVEETEEKEIADCQTWPNAAMRE
ncbi:hypothetical protein AVEN_177094-1 [Araneus ventricosus]|uniref:Uncharacterized protein n=1 Tax=Araneus ventricosus TaxID=182803 RepID=A0A4Y2CTD5_ARAVE|nr:hypothetical protein AVEN_177094-1 [Araneus ventricosus]